MKLLFSDYDGTFKEDENNSTNIYKNKHAISSFMAYGNIFGFATGRSFSSIKNETNKYSIPYNYLVCNNGSTVFDSKDTLLYSSPILADTLFKTLDYLESLDILSSIELKNAYGENTYNSKEVIEIICTLKIKNTFDISKIKNELSFLQSISFLNIVVLKEEKDKKDGIQFIANQLRVPKSDIYTIGDEFNDEKMLQEFNGYKMPISNPSLLFKGISYTPSVRYLVRKLERTK